VLEDALAQLQAHAHELRKPLRVTFLGGEQGNIREEAVDEGAPLLQHCMEGVSTRGTAIVQLRRSCSFGREYSRCQLVTVLAKHCTARFRFGVHHKVCNDIVGTFALQAPVVTV
jgi:hypothetical protein